MRVNGAELAVLLAAIREGDKITLITGVSHLSINAERYPIGVLGLSELGVNHTEDDAEERLRLFYLMGVVFDAALRLRGLALSAPEGFDERNKRIPYFSSDFFLTQALPFHIDRGGMMANLTELDKIVYTVVRA